MNDMEQFHTLTHFDFAGLPFSVDAQNGEDILSNLPENILTSILSLLPAKDAFRTCLLSKSWEYRWTTIHNIDIRDGDRFSLTRPARKNHIIELADRVLLFSRTPNIAKFRLSLTHHNYNPVRVATWIATVLLRGVQNLHVDVTHQVVVLPRCLFHCTSLTKLKLLLPSLLRVPFPNSTFPNLKYLHLSLVELLSELGPEPRQLVFNFPVLETVWLENCRWSKLHSVDFKAPSLTQLIVHEYPSPSHRPTVQSCLIKISEAKSLTFDYYGSCLGKFNLGASHVLRVSLLYEDALGLYNRGFGMNGSHAKLLLAGCSGLNQLKLSGHFAEAICRSKQGPRIPQLSMLKRLEVFASRNSGWILELLHELLHVMPSLEWIKLTVNDWNDYDFGLVESVPPCIVSHLNEVVFFGFHGRRSQVQLADFLLKNATGLKKMLGLSRDRSAEKRAQKEFWDRLKGAFEIGHLELGPSVKTMTDFRAVFG